MAEIDFCNLAGQPLPKALAALLEPLVAEGGRAVLLTGSAERLESLNVALWTYSPGSFLPHGSAADGHAERQPVWLTTREENPNGASLLVLLDDAEAADPDAFARCVFLFDRSSPEIRELARERWRRWREAGHRLRYLEYGPEGWRSGAG